MTKATVTYKAPPGDSKVCEHAGYTFFDGVATDVELDDFRLEKLKNNALFKVGEGGKADTVADPKHKHIAK
ncbi:hypothetical protein JQ581_29955 [Bradyrhizobium liaoningense]|uniref:hypothetical protein n=1 Tax=Bradyrhizobium liaoningense TaxID=43992 RepID=UPI001BABBA37|nr:hypothetical protein [Bradyrhizobium liaoningense]MBR0741164.1 hypothetical protein [Bradyrhizobium liaoningense]